MKVDRVLDQFSQTFCAIGAEEPAVTLSEDSKVTEVVAGALNGSWQDLAIEGPRKTFHCY